MSDVVRILFQCWKIKVPEEDPDGTIQQREFLSCGDFTILLVCPLILTCGAFLCVQSHHTMSGALCKVDVEVELYEWCIVVEASFWNRDGILWAVQAPSKHAAPTWMLDVDDWIRALYEGEYIARFWMPS